MEPKRRQLLLKTLRGNNFRRAVKAIAELRASPDPALVSAVAQPGATDEQRKFQARVAAVVLQKGMKGLVDEWTALGDAKWRADLISEIGQFVDLWGDKDVIELLLVALNDSDRQVQIKAVWTLLAYVTETSDKKKKRAVKSTSQKRFVDGAATVRGWMTPAQRSRMTQALSVMLERHGQTPYPVLPQIVEALGYTACKKNREVIEQLEALCSHAGEPYRVSYETVDAANFTWFENLVTAKKGIAPEQMTRIIHTPTGLLDRKLLEAALARIKSRED